MLPSVKQNMRGSSLTTSASSRMTASMTAVRFPKNALSPEPVP
jgi:hypothetical protein